MTAEHLAPFLAAYRPGEPLATREESVQFKRYAYGQIAVRPGYNLGLWANVEEEGVEDPADLPGPEVIAEEIAERLAGAAEQFEALGASLRARRALAAGEEPNADAVAALTSQ